MTSLFRRSSSNGGSRGGSSAQELNNSRPARQVRRLEFNQAMEDFKTMFPNMDYDIIECVLRANNGAVDATIDQLLQMNLDSSGCDDSSDSEDSIPPEILERTLEPDSSDEEPPPVYSPPAYESQALGSRCPRAPPTPPPRTDVPGPGSAQAPGRYRNWNPPLLGNLPEDFLRILPQQAPRAQGSPGCRQPVPRGLGPRGQGSLEQERRWKQYLEDERIALFLQNEEFMKELQRNRDFLLALERDRLKYESKKSKSSSVAVSNDFGFSSVISGDAAPPVSSEAGGAVSDDALFRDKLKHMGKSTRKKLFELARAFSEKTKMRKSKRKHLLKHQVYPKRGSLPSVPSSWEPLRGCRVRAGQAVVPGDSARLWFGEEPSQLPPAAGLGAVKGHWWCCGHVLAPDAFSLAEGAGWGQQLPRQIFSTMSKDTRAMKTSKHGGSSSRRRRRRQRKGSKWSQHWALLLAQNMQKA